MIIDNKGRLFGKVSIIDLIVLAAVIILAVSYLYRDQGTQAISGGGKTVTLKIVCNYAFPGAADSLEVGDQLVASSGLTNAFIKEITAEQAWETAPDAQGQMQISRNPFRQDVYLTIVAENAQVTPAEIVVAGQKVRAGKEDFYMKTQTVELKATVLSVQVD